MMVVALGWKIDLFKKVVETAVINIAVLTANELFKEGARIIRLKMTKKEDEPCEECSRKEKGSESCSESSGNGGIML